jgi:hypothetical protein
VNPRIVFDPHPPSTTCAIPNAGDVEEVLDSLVFPRFATVRYEPETPTLAAVAETVRERSGLSKPVVIAVAVSIATTCPNIPARSGQSVFVDRTPTERRMIVPVSNADARVVGYCE